MELKDWIMGSGIALLAILGKFLHWHSGVVAEKAVNDKFDAHNKDDKAHRSAYVDWGFCNAKEYNVLERLSAIDKKLEHVSTIVERMDRERNGRMTPHV